AVGNNISVENIGSNIKGIMRLIKTGIFRDIRLYNFSCQQHSAGFSADCAASDHPVSEQKIVLRTEITFYQFFQNFIPRHHAGDDLILGLAAESSAGVFVPCGLKEPVVAVKGLILCLGRRLLKGLIKTAHTDTVLHGGESVFCLPVTVRK